MSRVFCIGDLHFGHESLIRHLRKFPDVYTHDELIISNWNKVVTKRDTVYILGDVAMENDKNYYQLDRLNGRKIIIGGNHDSPKHIRKLMEYCDCFAGCVDYKGCILTHIPIHESCIWECRANIHGHLHYLTIDHPKYISVSCEQINYTPILFDELMKKLNKE